MRRFPRTAATRVATAAAAVTAGLTAAMLSAAPSGAAPAADIPAASGSSASNGSNASNSAPIHYRDPAVADRAGVQVTGTLLPVESDAPAGGSAYLLDTGAGHLVPVSLDRIGELHSATTFTGRLALGRGLARRSGLAGGETAGEHTPEGRSAIQAADGSSAPLAVSSATLSEPDDQQRGRTASARSSTADRSSARPSSRTSTRTSTRTTSTNGTTATARTATTSAHRLYVALIANRGRLDSAATIAKQTAAMRSYWQTESGGAISSFRQPSATVRYNSSAAGSTSKGCGLADPNAVWNEAARKFPGVSFDYDSGNHLMVLIPEACSGAYGAGIATIGSSLGSGGYSIVSLGSGGVQIGVHELGHNLSLQHANAQRCSGSRCSTQTYFDLYSIMGLAITGGSWTPPALDSAYRLQEGIATSADVATVTSSRTVHLAGRATGGGVRGFVVTDPKSHARYAVEYRSGTSRDASAFYVRRASIGSFAYRPGVVIERLERDGQTTMMTRAVKNSYYTSYVAGERFTAGSLTLSVTAASPKGGADVRVTVPASSSAGR